MRRISWIIGLGLLWVWAIADTSSVSISNLQSHVRILASPEMEGRLSHMPGGHKAADYIARMFESYGLEPKGTDGYFQDFEVTIGFKPGANNRLRIVPQRGTAWNAPAEGFRPVNLSDNKEVSGEVVFVGYGISVPDAGYDDYATVDVKGKVVAFLRGAPQWDEVSPEVQRAGRLANKVRTAVEKGAVGILVLNAPDNDRLLPLGMRGRTPAAGVAILNLTTQTADRLLRPANLTVAEAIKQISEKRTPISRAIEGIRVEMSASLEPNRGTARNVIGFVPGNDPNLRNEVIVVGAHYDHLGYGEVGSLAPEPGDIHYGADDNASGTAGVMELARLIAQNREKLGRSVLFIAFSAEEIGLVGADYFLRNCTVPVESIVAMFNFDMIGRSNGGRVSISGVGTSADWEPILRAAQVDGLQAQLQASASGGSDHAVFIRRNIPAVFFFTGMHPDYHRPSDTWDKINYEDQARIVAMAERAIYAVSTRPQRMTFTRPAQPQQTQGNRGFRVRIGLVPEYSEGQGVLLGGVVANSPAERAGLKAGDRILAVAGQRVNNIEELTALYEKMEPGKPVEFTILREGKEMKVQVTPAAPQE
ncbi:MAG: M20/M25/M40 family metallo-hydrolase [Fimbriimonadales bacterium]